MTIKDVAKLAGVSVSTVSKVLNKTDASISDVTRERVLLIARQYQYTPYAKIRKKDITNYYLIALIADCSGVYSKQISNLQVEANKLGYGIAVYDQKNDTDKEYETIQKISQNIFDGLIYIPSDTSIKNLDAFQALEIPKLAVNLLDENVQVNSANENTYNLGKYTTDYCIDKGYSRIGVANDPNYTQMWRTEAFLSGYVQSLANSDMPFYSHFITKKLNFEKLLQNNADVVICQSNYVAAKLYEYANKRNINIGSKLSIICSEKPKESFFYPSLCGIYYDEQKFSKHLISHIVDQIETGKMKSFEQFSDVSIVLGSSAKGEHNNHKIIVVGSANMDIMLNVPQMPVSGQTYIADNLQTYYGGKGSNQAIGIGKLGGNVHFIGCVGEDQDGRLLLNNMSENNVNIQAVEISNSLETGKAYIYIEPSGESSIVAYAGANSKIDRIQLKKNEHVFKDSEYCLLQTELRDDVILYTTEMASSYGVKMILKPSARKAIDKKILEKTYLFIPNEKEAMVLTHNQLSIEESAQYFLDQGVENVIITLSERGCYFRNKEKSRYFAALDVKAVDTTGAADAFISALVTFLAREKDMEKAISFANYAAGLSTTQFGVNSAMATQYDLNAFLDGNR